MNTIVTTATLPDGITVNLMHDSENHLRPFRWDGDEESHQTLDAAMTAVTGYAVFASITDLPEGLDETTLVTLAEYRVNNTPRLIPYTDTIFTDWPNWAEHIAWIITAPVAEIVNWADVVRS